MKKILTLVMLIGVAIMASSCQKEVTQVVQPANRTITFTIEPNKWALSSDASTYTTFLDVPEIDSYLQKNGAVLVYINRSDNGDYDMLPMLIDQVTYAYSTNLGQIRLEAQFYDGVKPAPPRPQLIYAKVVLLDSDPI